MAHVAGGGRGCLGADGSPVISARRHRAGLGDDRRRRSGRLLDSRPSLHLLGGGVRRRLPEAVGGPAQLGEAERVPDRHPCWSRGTPATRRGAPVQLVYAQTRRPSPNVRRRAVQGCLAFARPHNVQLTARSGGHSYGGYSSCPGLVIDVSQMNAISTGGPAGAWSKGRHRGGGCHADRRLQPAGRTGSPAARRLMPDRRDRRTALGGGIGVFSRAYGLTCDQMATVEIVTADGVVRRCGPGQDEDLYWASRGGGGGNFGIVTSFGFGSIRFPSRSPCSPWSGRGGSGLRPRRLAPMDPVHARPAVGQLPAVQQRDVGRDWSRSRASSGLVSACSAALNPLTLPSARPRPTASSGPRTT